LLADDDLLVLLLGLLLCAKTKVAKVRLASYFAEGAINAGNKRCQNFSFLIWKDFFCMYSHHAMDTVLVTKIIYRDKSEFGEERKISKFYRALVTGILDNDEVIYPSPYLFNTLF
jgi:hypothetical protein